MGIAIRMVMAFGGAILLAYALILRAQLAESEAACKLLQDTIEANQKAINDARSELARRDEIIQDRDKTLAEQQTEAESARAELRRIYATSKDANEWGHVCLPADVSSVLSSSGKD